ncbi:conserved hypothetical protein [Thermotomaculum hydrothermale]|uniref:Polymer-forming cytoskeletal protein n=1 Tax=Thermotomaculum hydrothermale TaxID=981385 RepID=A0A7R6Q0S7_9BACT|nr:polymer-forming cytoskeletal protein [Thermotomaculum hydrothermale]BBB33478.1 conserved hypothetical protein [Thermotomaculum hydrothermale]
MKERELNGFLDKGTFFKGEVTFKNLLRVDGKLNGVIRSNETLIIGEDADVEGEVFVGTCIINGRFKGKIEAKNKIEIHSKAIVEGEIKTPVLEVKEGGIFNGNCIMTKSTKEEKIKK